MIARAKVRCGHTLQDRFVELLPQIRQQARFAFRGEPRERRDERVAEVIANAFVAYVRLVERGLEDLVYPTPLVQFAIRQVRSGRKVGGSLNVNDVSSEYAQRTRNFVLESLDHYSRRKQAWKEVLVEDRRAGPAETATCRIDFGRWLGSLPRRQRRIAQTLAKGETTKATAKRFRVSAARVSQLRRELMQDWHAFHGELASA